MLQCIGVADVQRVNQQIRQRETSTGSCLHRNTCS
jgi:hypothetical protein